MHTSEIEKALTIAVSDLRWCYREKGIISGSRMVYWSWDSFFASEGALCLGDTEIVKKNLLLYLDNQNQDGQLPKRIANPLYWMRYIGVPLKETVKTQRPTFWNTYFTGPSIAQNPTFIIALHSYSTKTNDYSLFLDRYKAIEKVVSYLESRQGKHGLLKEGIGGGWAESVLKRGAIAFTNMCYARSLWCMANMCKQTNNELGYKRYLAQFEALKETINHTLWSDKDGGYYSDWYSFTRHHYFATDGNLLAILWDIATPHQALKIQQKIDELTLEDDIPIKLAYSKYSFWRIYPFMRIGGMKDYHVGFSWTWLGCIDGMVRMRLGQPELAREILEKIAAVIVRDGTVHETYTKGKAVQTPFYKSENPWGWGAGLFVAACYQAGIRYKK